ncbi:hypothetical protein KDN24_08445 [Bacillus sp. Bva_UNVM-123]|uniref:hypothetical protein n=1 Tax=Bacillus sp. Bva_UNVM-123 TaxID=2829798 RepID=UPI00391F2E89
MNQMISRQYRLKFQSDILLFMILLFIAVIFTFSLVKIAIIASFGLVAITFYSIFKLLTRSSESKHILLHQVTTDMEKIKRGLLLNKKIAEKKIQHTSYLDAYEILRSIGLFWNDDSIKELKLICLNSFIIRKDMPLEMDTVVPNMYSKEYVTYLGNAVKVQRNLVNKKVLDYVVTYEEQILEHFSKEILINVAGAALRMKHYFILYEEFIMKYVEDMPKERVLRLSKLLELINIQEVEHSKERVNNLIRSRNYGSQKEMVIN